MRWLTADWVQPRSRATALRLPASHTGDEGAQIIEGHPRTVALNPSYY